MSPTHMAQTIYGKSDRRSTTEIGWQSQSGSAAPYRQTTHIRSPSFRKSLDHCHHHVMMSIAARSIPAPFERRTGPIRRDFVRVERVDIQWHPRLPIFACEPFLKAVGDDYGWLGGFSESNELLCVLPFTVLQKAFIRLIRFRVETIPIGRSLQILEEKSFLNGAMAYFRSIGADVVIPATTNAIFRTYPDGAVAAPYGSYIIDLSLAEDDLWRKIERITRQNINSARKKGVVIQSGPEHLNAAYPLIRDTFKRSKLPFMDQASFRRFVDGLGEHALIMKADYQGVGQSYVVFAFSDYAAYAVYAGNIPKQVNGANKLLYWEAIRMFKSLGVCKYDFVGARINPDKGSKQEALSSLKKHFGAELIQGFIWKYPIRPLKYRIYGLVARFRSGGDIVDAERHKLPDFEARDKDETS